LEEEEEDHYIESSNSVFISKPICKRNEMVNSLENHNNTNINASILRERKIRAEIERMRSRYANVGDINVSPAAKEEIHLRKSLRVNELLLPTNSNFLVDDDDDNMFENIGDVVSPPISKTETNDDKLLQHDENESFPNSTMSCSIRSQKCSNGNSAAKQEVEVISSPSLSNFFSNTNDKQLLQNDDNEVSSPNSTISSCNSSLKSVIRRSSFNRKKQLANLLASVRDKVTANDNKKLDKRKEITNEVICLGGDTRRNSHEESPIINEGEMTPAIFLTPRTFNRNVLSLSVEAGRKSAEIEFGEWGNQIDVDLTCRFG